MSAGFVGGGGRVDSACMLGVCSAVKSQGNVQACEGVSYEGSSARDHVHALSHARLCGSLTDGCHFYIAFALQRDARRLLLARKQVQVARAQAQRTHSPAFEARLRALQVSLPFFGSPLLLYRHFSCLELPGMSCQPSIVM